MKRINIQTDTFCATGCSYCYLATREQNKAVYDMEYLEKFLSWYKPISVSIYGADTFYDVKQTLKVLDVVLKTKSVRVVPIISEVSKLEKDMDCICTIYSECKKRNILYTPEFSCDLFGVKARYVKQDIEKLYERTQCDTIFLKCVLTVEQILKKNIVERLNVIRSELGNAHVKSISFRIVIDYNAISSDIDISKHVASIVSNIKHTDKLFFTFSNDIHGKQMFCASRNREELLVDVYGNISTCAKTHPEYELSFKTTIFSDEVSWNKMINSAKIFREYNDTVVLKQCMSCEAKAHCNVCVKYVYKYYGSSFSKNTTLCTFYKTITKKRMEGMA